MATKFDKVFSGYQIPDDDDDDPDGPRNVDFIQTTDAADSPRTSHQIYIKYSYHARCGSHDINLTI